jgi:hypothetical protein
VQGSDLLDKFKATFASVIIFLNRMKATVNGGVSCEYLLMYS